MDSSLCNWYLNYNQQKIINMGYENHLLCRPKTDWFYYNVCGRIQPKCCIVDSNKLWPTKICVMSLNYTLQTFIKYNNLPNTNHQHPLELILNNYSLQYNRCIRPKSEIYNLLQINLMNDMDSNNLFDILQICFWDDIKQQRKVEIFWGHDIQYINKPQCFWLLKMDDHGWFIHKCLSDFNHGNYDHNWPLNNFIPHNHFSYHKMDEIDYLLQISIYILNSPILTKLLPPFDTLGL